MVKAVFCDRDGVITKLITRTDTENKTAPWYQHEIEYYPRVEESIIKAKALGYKFFIVSNQPDQQTRINGTLLKINLQLTEWGVDDIEYAQSRGTYDYKPNPGMIEKLTKKYNVSIRDSWMIGDTWKDSVCARLARLRYLHVGEFEAIGPTIYSIDLPTAIAYIELDDSFEGPNEKY